MNSNLARNLPTTALAAVHRGGFVLSYTAMQPIPLKPSAPINRRRRAGRPAAPSRYQR